MKYKELSEKIKGCAYNVYNKMGYGYLISTGIDVGILINFGQEGVEIKRKVRDLKDINI